MIKPTFTGRRSKEEREALAKEQKERETLRNAERDAANQKKERERKNLERREQRNMHKQRGGMSGAVSGPFSMGSSREGMLRVPCSTNGTNLTTRPEKHKSQHVWIRVWVWIKSDTHQK